MTDEIAILAKKNPCNFKITPKAKKTKLSPMSLYCDDEMDIHTRDDGRYARIARKESMKADLSRQWFLPDDVISILAEYSCEYLTDQLAFSLLSPQHQSVVRRRLVQQSGNLGDKSFGAPSMFQMEGLGEYFLNWSQIRFGGEPEFVTNVDSSRSALSFYCKTCHNLIITQTEVESPHYHGGFGPAFLAHHVYNCHQSAEEAYETQFTTGVYRVCDVTCLGCQARIGKKYIEARDPSNQFKVGRILLEQTLLTMPKCCHNRKLKAFPPDHYFCSRESGSFCSVCFEGVRRGAARAVLEMTKNLERNLTMKLLALLTAERRFLAFDTDRSMELHSPASTADCSPSISQRFGDAISRVMSRRSSPPSSLAAMNCSAGVPSKCCGGKLVGESIACISHLIGSRIAMLPDCQNWIVTTRFLTELIASVAKGSDGFTLMRTTVLEALVASCGPLSFHSATLLMSRVQTLEDRRAVLDGIAQNDLANFSSEESDQLLAIVNGHSGRWFSAGAQTANSSLSSSRG